jgi:hypothetical protein
LTSAKQQAVNQIIADQEQAWIDPLFQPRDQNQINAEVFGDETSTDPRFAPLASDTPMSLRNQLTRMVRESQSDPELRQQLSEAGVDLPRTSWRFYSQGWTVDIALQGGWWIVAATNDDSREKRHFKLQDTQAGDRDEAMAAVGRVLSQDTPRTIPKSDRLRIERMAAGGNLPEALAEYILLRLPARVAAELRATEATGDWNTIERFANTPKWQPLLREGILAVFHYGSPHADPNDPAWLAYIDKHTRDRVLTFKALESLWTRYQMYLEDQKRSSILGLVQKPDNDAEEAEPAAVTESLDAMDDEAFARTYRAVLEHRAKQARRA